MCRWFVYISETEDCLLEDVLVTPQHSLSKQVHDHYLPKLFSHDPNATTSQQEITTRNRLFNVDGFGMAWYTDAKCSFGECDGLRPALYKAIQPPINDKAFRSICANTTTRVVFAHIRASSGSAITPVNNHPFVFGRHSFMHNGYISDFKAISRQMCDLMDDDAYSNINGSTDSEHMAALYMTYLVNGKGKAGWELEYSTDQMRAALLKAVNTVIALQKKKLAPEQQPNDLNLVTTDGTHLVAYRFRNHPTQQPPSLYCSTTAGITMNRKYPDHPDNEKHVPTTNNKPSDHGNHVIVASEPTTYKEKEWSLIEKNHCLTVETDGSIDVCKIEYDA